MHDDPLSKRRAELEKRKAQLSQAQRAKLEQRLEAGPIASSSAAAPSKPFIAPRTETEQQIAAIWCRALSREQISIDENFFELGGHSLLAVKVTHEIHDTLGALLPMRVIFEDATIAGLAAQIEAGRQQQPRGYLLTPIPQLAAQLWYAISHAQRRLLIVDQADRTRRAYLQPEIWTIEGALDVAALERAFRSLVERHEILRTAFPFVQGDYRQVIHDADCFHLRRIDAREQPDQEALLEQIYHEERTTPFDLDRAPLLRVTLIQTADDRAVLVMTSHHVILDGWSEGILYRELALAYEAYRRGETPLLPPLQIQYKDYAAWHNALIESGTFDTDLEYFRRRFADGVPPSPIQTDKPRPKEFSYHGDILAFHFAQEQADALRELATRGNASLFMISFSALVLLLSSYRKQREIVVGTVTTGQLHPDMQNMIGFFVNTLPLSFHVDPETTYLEYLQSFKHTLLEALEHQFYPFDKLVDELGVKVDRSHAPLFDILVIGQDFGGLGSEIETPAETVIDLQPQKLVRSLYDLKFEFTHSDQQGIFLNLEYNTDLFDRSTITFMRRQLEHLVAQIAGNPERRVRDFDYRPAGAPTTAGNDLDFDIEL
jgi:acyl carrier protein